MRNLDEIIKKTLLNMKYDSKKLNDKKSNGDKPNTNLNTIVIDDF